MASPLLGYNNNFRHKNRVFHVQTEDSGVKHPHIITHLFADGGRIVKSVKTGYAEYLGNAKMTDIVKEMMKQQHKAMIIALRDGQFDHLLELPRPSSAATAAVTGTATSALPGPPPATAPAPPPRPSSQAPPSASPGGSAAGAEEDDTPDTARNPQQDHELTLDIDALERAAAAAETESQLFTHGSDLPPPPENLFREKTATGAYKSVAPPAPSDTERPPARRGVRMPTVPGPPRAPNLGIDAGVSASASRAKPPAGTSEGRYGNARPAAIFGNKSKAAAPKTLFGEDLISDKSLDEVILSYLAEDLDPQGGKK